MDAAGDVGAPGSGSLDSRPSFGRRVVSCRVLGEIWGETVWPGRGNGEMGKWAPSTHTGTPAGGTRAKSWPSGRLSLATACSHKTSCTADTFITSRR